MQAGYEDYFPIQLACAAAPCYGGFTFDATTVKEPAMTRMIEEARCIFTRLWADAVWGNRSAALSFRPARPRRAARPMPHPQPAP